MEPLFEKVLQKPRPYVNFWSVVFYGVCGDEIQWHTDRLTSNDTCSVQQRWRSWPL